MKTSTKLDINLGQGWKLVPTLKTNEVLVLKVLDGSSDGPQHFSWICLDPSSAWRARLPVQSKLPGGGAVVYHEPSTEMFYRGSAGITGFNLKTKQESVHYPLDFDRNDVWDLWLSPEDSPILAYIFEEREESRTRMRAKAAETQSGGPFYIRAKYSLHLWEKRTKTSHLITRFEAIPGSLAIDWGRNAAYALVGEKKKKDLIRIDLKSKKASLVRSTESVDSVEISPQHTLLTWRHYNSPKIFETLEDGQDHSLTEFGWHPAYSPDGQRLAFTVEDYEVWVKDSNSATPEKVIAFLPEQTQHTLDTIKWCSCANHFAVCLSGSRGEKTSTRPLMIVDCARKEVRVVEDLSLIGTRGERVWVSRDVVMGYPIISQPS